VDSFHAASNVKTPRFITFIVLVLLAELVLSAVFSFRAVNLAKYSYRHAERYAAIEKLRNDNSPENEAAYRQELRMAGQHVSHRQLEQTGIVFLLFLGLDAATLDRTGAGNNVVRRTSACRRDGAGESRCPGWRNIVIGLDQLLFRARSSMAFPGIRDFRFA
jgi:hypothetical protein